MFIKVHAALSILFRLDAGYNLFPLNNFCDVKTNVLITILALHTPRYCGTPLKGQQVNPYGKTYRRLTTTDLLVRTGLSLPSWTYQHFFVNCRNYSFILLSLCKNTRGTIFSQYGP